MKNLVIVSALKDEIVGLVNQMTIERAYRQDRAQFFDGTLEDRPVIVGYTGIGVEASQAALEMLTQLVTVGAVIGTGYCGALAEDLETGALVLANEVCALVRENPGTIWHADEALLQACRQSIPNGDQLTEGRLLCVSQALTAPEQKRAAGKNFQAVAVDMESGGVASFCEAAAIPCVMLRVVLDPVRDKVPDPSVFLDRQKRISKRRVLKYVVRNPQAVWELPKLGAQAKKARQRIAEVLPAVIKVLNN